MIREFREEDLDEVIALGQSLDGSFDISKKGELEKILVYEEKGAVVGFIDYYKLYETLEVLYIAVREDYRRKGIGKRLISSLLNDEVFKCLLEVKISNESAIKFYESLGFKSVRTIKNYGANGEDALEMELSI